MRLASLIAPAFATLAQGRADTPISGLTADSRQVRPGTLFAALSGTKVDGTKFVPDAIAKGATAILTDTRSILHVPDEIAILRAEEPRRALAMIAARFFPRQPGTVVAITGTNGKTSIAEFTRQIFAALGHKAASLGTIGVVKPNGAAYGSLTTPDPVSLHRTLDELAGEGITHLAIEASSHGLDQFRLDGLNITAAAFNNLGRDHLDYHPTMEAYFAAKLMLFERLLAPSRTAIVNTDGPEPFTGRVIAAARARGQTIMTTGRTGESLRLRSAEIDGFRQRLVVEHAGQCHTVTLNLIGDYQASNALVAVAFALAIGADPTAAIHAMETLQGVKGRLEVAARHNGGIVVVDYAHKPEALAACLDALRPFATGKIITVFGCGGDRDKGKRPIMGRIAAEKSDLVIVTDDNPRTEVPATIRAEVRAGCPTSSEIGDRAAAIAEGVGAMTTGDVLLVAGKGHEPGQIIGSVTQPFVDHEAIAAAIAGRRYRPM